jgi:hypothetical protein
VRVVLRHRLRPIPATSCDCHDLTWHGPRRWATAAAMDWHQGLVMGR